VDDGRGLTMILTFLFPVFAWVGLMGLIVSLAKSWRRRRAIAFALVGIAGLVGMAWASLAVFTVPA